MKKAGFVLSNMISSLAVSLFFILCVLQLPVNGTVLNEEDNAHNDDCGTASTVSGHRYQCTFHSYLDSTVLEREYEVTFESMTDDDKISSIGSQRRDEDYNVMP